MKINELQKLAQFQWDPSAIQDKQKMLDFLRESGIDPGAFYQELEMDARYVNTHRDTSYSNDAVHLHSHSFYELLCCRNTCGVEYLVGAQRYRLQKGDIVFVAPGISHRPILPEQMTEPYQRDVLWFSEEFARFLLEHLPQDAAQKSVSTNMLRTAGTKWEFLPELFHKGVLEAEGRETGWELAVIGNTMLILSYLKRALEENHGPSRLSAETPELLDQIMEYIEAHLSERITLGDTARHFYVSDSTISHLFRQKMGVSFYRCVTQRRLIAAKELIWQGAALETVSTRVGFRDYSSFYRAFKQEYGISPQQYRKLQSPGENA